MTLAETIKMIEVVASKQPSVNMIVRNDVFRLNEKADARYGVFAWTQGQHSTRVDGNSIDYAFNFFYIDRLKNDRSNQLEIQSVVPRLPMYSMCSTKDSQTFVPGCTAMSPSPFR